jgi:hypothetical protein
VHLHVLLDYAEEFRDRPDRTMAGLCLPQCESALLIRMD